MLESEELGELKGDVSSVEHGDTPQTKQNKTKKNICNLIFIKHKWISFLQLLVIMGLCAARQWLISADGAARGDGP